MQFGLSAFVAIVVGLALAGVLACGQDAPTPTPTPRSVESLYKWLKSEKENNPERLEYRAERGEIFGLTGEITDIEDSKIQFHISRAELGKDEFVECEFSNYGSILSLNIGDPVTVYGKLHKAFPTGKLGQFGFKDNKAVKFRECRLTGFP